MNMFSAEDREVQFAMKSFSDKKKSSQMYFRFSLQRYSKCFDHCQESYFICLEFKQYTSRKPY